TSGNKAASISGDIEPNAIEGKGNSTEVTVKNLVLKSEEFPVDLTSIDEKIGQVTVSFQANLKSLPQNASVKATISQDPNREAQAAFQLAVIEEGNKVAGIACTINIKKTNLENGTDLGEAIIIMKTGRAWVEKHGVNSISIMRYSEEEEETQKLTTTFEFEGYEGEQGVFQAISPDGLSIFGLAAVAPLPAISNWMIILIGVGGGIIVAVLIIYFLIRRRRQRETALRGKWATGLRPEDWK
ncbi:MAG TPA: hypothetical protein VJ441_03600, partial [Dehalococcoidia bacterium]|nr:hypothetical protein [Dehalococcoidia bacterium]